jgi:hypothetical protein
MLPVNGVDPGCVQDEGGNQDMTDKSSNKNHKCLLEFFCG